MRCKKLDHYPILLFRNRENSACDGKNSFSSIFGKTFHIPCPPWGYWRWALGMMPSLRAAELSQVVFSWSEFRGKDFVLVLNIHWLLWSIFGNYSAIQFSLKLVSAPCVFGHIHEKVIKPYLYLIFKQQEFCS